MLQYHVTTLTEDSLELRVWLTLLHHGQVVPESPQTGFEFVMVEAAGAFLVEVFEHHGELLEGVLAHSGVIPGLYLLFQVMLHTHGQLVQLVPLLG